MLSLEGELVDHSLLWGWDIYKRESEYYAYSKKEDKKYSLTMKEGKLYTLDGALVPCCSINKNRMKQTELIRLEELLNEAKRILSVDGQTPSEIHVGKNKEGIYYLYGYNFEINNGFTSFKEGETYSGS